MRSLLAILALPVVAAAAQSSAPRTPAPAPAGVPVYAATVVARFPHDSGAFTEGLLFCDGALYESTGRVGQSEIRRVELASGKTIARVTVPPPLFGEGIACWRHGLISVTWQTGQGFRWSLPALKRTGTFRYKGEGWGMTTAPRGVLLTDGSATIQVKDPATFADRGRIAVTLNGRPVRKLNELEWIDGALWANVWMTSFIVRIDPASGRVTAIMDLRPLIAEIGSPDPDAVANGIAWDPATKRMFITGKNWRTLFEVKPGERVGTAD